jgi:hypothetical protein
MAIQKIARVIDLEIKVCKDKIAKEFCKGVLPSLVASPATIIL